MISNMFHLTLVRGGVVPSMGSSRPWAPTMSGAGSVPAQVPGAAAATGRSVKIAGRRRVTTILRPLAPKAELPLIDTRKPYVHMTRVTAGGDGAMGPHPEREQLA